MVTLTNTMVERKKFSIHKKIFAQFGAMDYSSRVDELAKHQIKEIGFNSFEDWATQMAEVSAVLEEYEGSHLDMKTQAVDAEKGIGGPEELHGPTMINPAWPKPGEARLDEYGLLDLKEEAKRLRKVPKAVTDLLALDPNLNIDAGDFCLYGITT